MNCGVWIRLDARMAATCRQVLNPCKCILANESQGNPSLPFHGVILFGFSWSKSSCIPYTVSGYGRHYVHGRDALIIRSAICLLLNYSRIIR